MERLFVMKSYMNPIINSYYKNGGEKLYNVVDKVLNSLHFYHVDKDDFYSLANEIFVFSLMDYEEGESFDRFLYSCLYKKFCSEMTSRTRDKRCQKIKVKEVDENGTPIEKTIIIQDESLDAPVSGDENYTIGEMLADDFTIENEIFEKREKGYSKRMRIYLSRLSNLQKKVLKLNIAGYLPNEIREELHISEKEYADCYAAIHSYRNVSVLF